jgi:hypothetical protein
VVKVVEDVTATAPSEVAPAATEVTVAPAEPVVKAEVTVAPAEPVAKPEVSQKKPSKKFKKSSPKKEVLVEVSSDEGELVEEHPVTEEPLPVEETKAGGSASEDVQASGPEMEEDEDEEFVRFTYEGVNYLRDEENSLYLDMDDDVEPVGTWDPVNSIPNFNAGVDIQALLSRE